MFTDYTRSVSVNAFSQPSPKAALPVFSGFQQSNILHGKELNLEKPLTQDTTDLHFGALSRRTLLGVFAAAIPVVGLTTFAMPIDGADDLMRDLQELKRGGTVDSTEEASRYILANYRHQHPLGSINKPDDVEKLLDEMTQEGRARLLFEIMTQPFRNQSDRNFTLKTIKSTMLDKLNDRALRGMMLEFIEARQLMGDPESYYARVRITPLSIKADELRAAIAQALNV